MAAHAEIQTTPRPINGPHQPFTTFAETLSPELSEARLRNQFLRAINEGRLSPLLTPPWNEGLIEAQPKQVITTAEDDRLHGIYKLVTRFNPQASDDDIKSLMRYKLEEFGLDPNIPIQVALNKFGFTGYFPLGVSLEGQLILEKVRFLPPDLHREVMQASSWKLVSDQARDGISRMHLFSVGLSVGSELLDVASRLGVSRFTIGDPSLNHADAGERLTFYRPVYKGWGKTPTAVWELLRRNPYIEIDAYYSGLTEANAIQFFSDISEKDVIPICAEEVDSFEGKVNARRTPRQLLDGSGIHTIMIADVGPTDIIFTYDGPDARPFDGRVGDADPEGDDYGSGLVASGGNMAALFASIGGMEHIPHNSSLLPILRAGAIGRDISTVPQPRGAVLLAGAAFYEALIAIAEGRGSELRSIKGITLNSELRN